MKRLVLAITVLAFSSLSLAEERSGASINAQQESAASLARGNAPQAAPAGPFSSANCASTFTSGAGDTFLKYCVTANGNVTVFETPAGHEQIAIGQIGEGYGICDFGDRHVTPVAYNDYAESGDSRNWSSATLLSNTAKSVKIARTTSDGTWTLTQTFTQVAGTSPSVKIAMTLKNNSNVAREVSLLRYADADADGVEANNLAATANSAFASNDRNLRVPRSGFGLVLQGAPFTPDPRSGPVGFVQFVQEGPNPCSPFNDTQDEPLLHASGAVGMLYDFVVPAGRSKSVTVSYKGL